MQTVNVNIDDFTQMISIKERFFVLREQYIENQVEIHVNNDSPLYKGTDFYMFDHDGELEGIIDREVRKARRIREEKQ